MFTDAGWYFGELKTRIGENDKLQYWPTSSVSLSTTHTLLTPLQRSTKLKILHWFSWNCLYLIKTSSSVREHLNPLMGTLKPHSNGPLYSNTAAAPSRPIFDVPNVTAHLSTASEPTSCYSMWHYNHLCTLLQNSCSQTRRGTRPWNKFRAFEHLLWLSLWVSC